MGRQGDIKIEREGMGRQGEIEIDRGGTARQGEIERGGRTYGIERDRHIERRSKTRVGG